MKFLLTIDLVGLQPTTANPAITMNDLVQRQRRRKHSFRPLPGGASGSSTNPETVARNRRRRQLSPLHAELDRISNNRRARIFNQTRALMKKNGWLPGGSAEGQEAALKEISDRSQARYEKEKIEVLKEFGEEVEVEASNLPPPDPAAVTAVNATTQPSTPTSQGSSDETEFKGLVAGEWESDSECEATGEEWEDIEDLDGEDWEVEEVSENEDGSGSSNTGTVDLREFVNLIQSGLARSIAAIEQSARQP
jgi:hypothetical protein